MVVCWIDDFKDWLESIRQRFPVKDIYYRNQDENFHHLLNRWINETKEGKDHLTANNIGLIDGKLKFMKFTA